MEKWLENETRASNARSTDFYILFQNLKGAGEADYNHKCFHDMAPENQQEISWLPLNTTHYLARPSYLAGLGAAFSAGGTTGFPTHVTYNR